MSPSLEADASAVTLSGATPVDGVTLRAATGAESDTLATLLAVAASPAVSLTVTTTVKAPAPW